MERIRQPELAAHTLCSAAPVAKEQHLDQAYSLYVHGRSQVVFLVVREHPSVAILALEEVAHFAIEVALDSMLLSA